MAQNKTKADLILENQELREYIAKLVDTNNSFVDKIEEYLPIIEEWNKTKNEQAIEIEAVISNAIVSRRVEYVLWLLNQPLIVLFVTLVLGIGIKYEISSPEDPFNLNSGTTWIVPIIVSALGTFLSALNRAYENSQKKGDAMILADIKREITPWLEKLETKMDQRIKDSEIRAEQSRKESEARAEQSRKESEARAEKQRIEDNQRLAKIFEAIEKKLEIKN